MRHRTVFLVLAGSMMAAACTTERPPSSTPPPRLVRHDSVRSRQAATPAPAPAPTEPASTDSETHAKYSFAVGGGPRSTIDPTTTIPSPPATIDVRPDAGVAAATKAVPAQIPVGHLSKETLESPLKDPTRFGHCGIPRTTRIDISVAIYNGQAIGVDVRSNPGNRSIDFCVERVVRQTTWVKELAINRVTVTL
jgi:hypothetical protein